MSNWYVGQKVACVDDTEEKEPFYCAYGEAKPEKGKVYTIRQIDTVPPEFWPLLNKRGLYDPVDFFLEEIVNKPGWYSEASSGYRKIEVLEQSFASYRFKPLLERKTDISIFQEILNKQTKAVGVQ